MLAVNLVLASQEAKTSFDYMAAGKCELKQTSFHWHNMNSLLNWFLNAVLIRCKPHSVDLKMHLVCMNNDETIINLELRFPVIALSQPRCSATPSLQHFDFSFFNFSSASNFSISYLHQFPFSGDLVISGRCGNGFIYSLCVF